MGERAKLVGVNHVALEVGGIDDALDFYSELFEFELRGRIGERMAFLDIGDQFIALSAGDSTGPDVDRHFGLVVDDADAFRATADAAGVELGGMNGLDFQDPWGNNVQVVDYREVQFERTEPVRRRLGIDEIEKSAEARDEMAEKGLD